MITDKILNIDIYDNIPLDIKNFIKSINNDVKLGKYELSEGNFVNIETYNTKNINLAKYEAHEKYIDIQFLISGKEKIYYTYKDNLKVETPYNKEKDIVFYSNKIESNYIELGGSNFIMLYPHEAHAPQIQIGNSETVKKVVVKVIKK